MADYCAKHLKYKRMAAIADDFAYGHEMLGGFQKVYQDAGGTLVQKLQGEAAKSADLESSVEQAIP